jgi:hypothetical protein
MCFSLFKRNRNHILITEPNREDTAAKALTSRGFAPYSPVVYKRTQSTRRNQNSLLGVLTLDSGGGLHY